MQVITIHKSKLAVVDDAIKVVCTQLNVPRTTLLSKRRTARVAWARQCAISISCELTDLDFEQLAPLFNRTPNGAVRYLCHRLREVCNGDERKKAEYETCRKLVMEKMKK